MSLNLHLLEREERRLSVTLSAATLALPSRPSRPAAAEKKAQLAALRMENERLRSVASIINTKCSSLSVGPPAGPSTSTQSFNPERIIEAYKEGDKKPILENLQKILDVLNREDQALLKAKLMERHTIWQEYSQQKNDLASRVSDLETELTGLEAEADTLQSSRKDIEMTKTSLANDIGRLRKDVDALQSIKDMKSAELNVINEAVADLHREKKSADEIKSTLSKEIRDIDAAVKVLYTRKEAADKAWSTLSRGIDGFKLAIQDLGSNQIMLETSNISTAGRSGISAVPSGATENLDRASLTTRQGYRPDFEESEMGRDIVEASRRVSQASLMPRDYLSNMLPII